MPGGWRGQYLRYRDFFLNILAVYRRRQDLKTFMEILFSLTTISVFSIFALKPTLLTIAQLIKDNQTKAATLATMDTKIKNLGIAQGVLFSEGAKIDLIEYSVPNSPSVESFVRQVEGLVQTHSVNLLGISIGEVTLKGPETIRQKKEGLTPLPEEAKGLEFSISVSGNYPNLSAFTSDFEKLRRPAKVDVLNFNVSVSETGRNLVLVISGRIPYLGEESASIKK